MGSNRQDRGIGVAATARPGRAGALVWVSAACAAASVLATAYPLAVAHGCRYALALDPVTAWGASFTAVGACWLSFGPHVPHRWRAVRVAALSLALVAAYVLVSIPVGRLASKGACQPDGIAGLSVQGPGAAPAASAAGVPIAK